MARLHLFELEDQPWFPRVVRDAGTAYLRFAVEQSGQAAILAPHLGDALRASGERQILDLCSGGAGPVEAVVSALAARGLDVHARLSDRYPNLEAFEWLRCRSEGRIDYVPEPLDATAVPRSLDGLRTLFNAFHHFRPRQARKILQDAVDAGRAVAVFEVMERRPGAFLAMLFAPLAVALSVPFLRPFRWGWLPLTYLLPVIPLFVLWDGLVSCLRVYSPRELSAMVAQLERADGWSWNIGRVRQGRAPMKATVLTGLPPRALSGERAGAT